MTEPQKRDHVKALHSGLLTRAILACMLLQVLTSARMRTSQTSDSDAPGHHTVFKSKCNAIAVARGERATNNGGFLSSLCHGLSQAANAAPASMYAWRCQNCSLSALSVFLDRCPPHLRCELDLSFVHALQTGAVILQ